MQAEYSAFVDSYAASRGWGENNLAKDELQRALGILLEQGLKGIYAVALAAVSAELHGFAVTLVLCSLGQISQESFGERLEEVRGEVLHRVAAWTSNACSVRLLGEWVPAEPLEAQERKLDALWRQYATFRKYCG